MTEDSWWVLLDSDPKTFPWDVFADWLEESVDDRASLVRQYLHLYAPLYVPNRPNRFGGSWEWWKVGRYPKGPDDLAVEVFFALKTNLKVNKDVRWRDCASYSTRSAAYRDLLDALLTTSLKHGCV